MSDGGYKIRNKKEIHFVTFAVVEWVDVFVRRCWYAALLSVFAYQQP